MKNGQNKDVAFHICQKKKKISKSVSALCIAKIFILL